MGNEGTLHGSCDIVAATWLKRKNDEIMDAVLAALVTEKIYLDKKDLTAKSRVFEVVFARSLCTFMLWGHYGIGATEVKKVWKSLDRSTIIHHRIAAVSKVESIGWCGRTYIKTCDALNEVPKDYIHPMIITKPVNRIVKDNSGNRVLRRANGTRSHLDVVAVSDWTPEERARMDIHRKYPGGPPRHIIEGFESRFKTVL